MLFNSNTSHVIVYPSFHIPLYGEGKNSNTSHVIVYRDQEDGKQFCWAFKYISCYCLSDLIKAIQRKVGDSNTSHVIVYPSPGIMFSENFCIQIHLMLLFIQLKLCYTSKLQLFKYISCYCLSQ